MITHEELKKLANLAKLSLADRNTDEIIADISEMLEFANAVSEVTADNTECSVPEMLPLRSDEVKESYPNEEILRNCGKTENGYFVALSKEEKNV